MQITWVIKEHNKRLMIVALGWGASVEVIGNQEFPKDTDVVALCDYRDLSSGIEGLELGRYKEKFLLAWSFGVWASEQLFRGVRFERAVAVAGTPLPISGDYGIDPRIFAVTMRGIMNEGVVQFVARMCGRHLREYLKNHSTRDLKDIQEELQILNNTSVVPYETTLNWTRAVICGDDLIFSPRTTERYWREHGVNVEVLTDVPHYPFYKKDFILCTINN